MDSGATLTRLEYHLLHLLALGPRASYLLKAWVWLECSQESIVIGTLAPKVVEMRNAVNPLKRWGLVGGPQVNWGHALQRNCGTQVPLFFPFKRQLLAPILYVLPHHVLPSAGLITGQTNGTTKSWT